MEYFRDSKNLIYADLAYRLGKIALQYERATFTEKKYEVTLYISFLQNLLANCNELIRAMKDNERKKSYFKAKLSENSGMWGISEEEIKQNTFADEDLTYETVISRIRNSLSHPTSIDISSEYPSTGYTTIKDESRNIKKLCFVNSPDTKGNRPKFFNTEEDANKALFRAKEGNLPAEVYIEKIDGRYGFYKDNKPFARIFRIDLPVENIRQLMLGLSNHLAQPIREQWDGESVVNIFQYKRAA